MSIFSSGRRAFEGVYTTCFSLALFTLLATNVAHSQISIDSVTVFPQAVSQTGSQSASTQSFVLEINGKGFETITNMATVHVAVFPATGIAVDVLSRSQDNSKILAQFTAPVNYALEGLALTTGSNLAPFDLGTPACDFKTKVTLAPQITPKSQAGNKYGNGIAKNFYAVQVSIVNECPMAVVVPLGGMSVILDDLNAARQDSTCPGHGILIPFSLDHVTSIYSTDRKSTGRRAIYFNTVQALATLGSAIEPFLPMGFTQGVSILGGGFTTASKDILVDMSAEQLQNLTSQSFGATEQIASHGSLQKFVFVRRDKSRKCRNSSTENQMRNEQFTVNWGVSAISAANAKALSAQPAKQ